MSKTKQIMCFVLCLLFTVGGAAIMAFGDQLVEGSSRDRKSYQDSFALTLGFLVCVGGLVISLISGVVAILIALDVIGKAVCEQ